MILDTNALSSILGGASEISPTIQLAPSLELPVIVLGEYLYGLQASTQRIRLGRDLLSLRNQFVLLEVNDATAHHYAEIRHALRLTGRPIPANDLWIAALARQHTLPILSRDAHFDAVEGIERFG